MMGNRRAIYTEKTQCRDCYKCVRECPVKAIRVKDSSAVVDHDLCIFCGQCVHVCPSRAKKIRNDITRADLLVKEMDTVIVSLAPSFPAFFHMTETALSALFKKKGVTALSETALGAEIVAHEQMRLSTEESRGMISTAYPVVVELVRKYYPGLNTPLSPLHSPMCAHARFLREQYTEKIGILFVGPCIAKKEEADRYPELVDVALTFEEAAAWIGAEDKEDAGASMRQDSDTDIFFPFRSGKASLFPVDGGMISAMAGKAGTVSTQFVSQSGTESIMKSLDSCNTSGSVLPLFHEYLACHGGCINGPGMPANTSVLESRMKVIQYADSCSDLPGTALPVSSVFAYEDGSIKSVCTPTDVVRDEIIESTLQQLGKINVEDRKDCGGCGYNTCRDFAVAYIQGKAEAEMCVTEMRKLAQRKAHVLMHTIPLGIVIMNANLEIVECNPCFLTQFSEFPDDTAGELITEVCGLPITRFCSQTGLFKTLINTGVTETTTIEHNNRIFSCQTFMIQPERLFGALFQDITAPAVRRETVIRKTEDVIRKNLESTQKIAGLLGETAAETEIILNSLIDAFDAKKHDGV